ncbi:MAG: guanylate kinase [Candidatus Hydrogenedentes bacterium]|jgi:guanylate kinase|nr:guanylate kinase [Candidatus Hydrogenedentota bacterium]
MNTGSIVVVSAPSGGGKDTLLGIAKEKVPALSVAVSATTRSPRSGEKEGEAYYFVSEQDFKDAIDKGDFAEWAKVHGAYYGTFKAEIERLIVQGGTCVLELDVQGMRHIKQNYPEAVTIFIVPPNLDVLKQRLIDRGANSEAEITLRLANAKEEMAAQTEFDHVVVNDNLDVAADELIGLFLKIAARKQLKHGQF